MSAFKEKQIKIENNPQKYKDWLEKQQNKIHNAGIKESERIGNQTVRKITPFMDLTG